MRITLAVTEGPHMGQKYFFEGHDTFIVGRSKRSHFRLPHKDKYFSRVHFMVEVNPPHCRLMDMGSTNGTFVNGEKVAMVDLKHGDEIKGGRTVLRVAVEGKASDSIIEVMPATDTASAHDTIPPSPPVSVPP